MAKKDAMFWLGAGVVHISGKEYGPTDPLPTKSIEKEKLERWEKQGKIGPKNAVYVADAAGDQSGALAEAGAKIAALETQVKELTAAGVEAAEKIVGLETQVEDLTKPTDGKGGPAGPGKAGE